MIDEIFNLIKVHMIEESGDGDAIVLFGKNSWKNYVPSLVLKLKNEFPEMKVSETETTIHFYALNENIELTCDNELYDRQPPWVFLKMEIFSDRRK